MREMERRQEQEQSVHHAIHGSFFGSLIQSVVLFLGILMDVMLEMVLGLGGVSWFGEVPPEIGGGTAGADESSSCASLFRANIQAQTLLVLHRSSAWDCLTQKHEDSDDFCFS